MDELFERFRNHESSDNGLNLLNLHADNSSNLKSYTSKVLNVIVANEGKPNTITPNDNGAGVSIGVRQWNQEVGELPDLLRAWHRQNPGKFQKLCGQHTNNLLDENWVRTSNFHEQPGLMNSLKMAANDKEFQQVQWSLSREFARNGLRIAQSHGFKSELGCAAITDMVNQCGFSGVEDTIKKYGIEKIRSSNGEMAAIEALERHLDRSNGKTRLENLKRHFSVKATAPRMLTIDDLIHNSLEV